MEGENNVSPEVTPRQSANPYLIPGAIIVAGALIAGAVMYSNTPRIPAGGAAVGGTINSGGIAPGDLVDDDTVLGDPKAPVTVVEFSDFQCPFCRKLFHDTLPMLKEKYVRTGKIKFVYRDFPLNSIHEMAQEYAEAAECADDQGKFWSMHDKIFEEQGRKGSGTVSDFTIRDVKRWARELGLNGEQFDQCMDTGKFAKEVEKDFQDGQAAGVNGTPATFINGRLVSGALPYTQFEAIIEEELKKAAQ